MLGGSTQQPPPRRLVVCCDGTWNSADGGEAASNVVRMARCVKPTASNGAAQIVYYHPGVGTGNRLDQLIGGTTGVGLARNVRDAYAFIVNNYVAGDEIFLFGFSRGAYTARSISGLIDTIGLLRERDMGGFLDAWAFYRMPEPQKERHRGAFEQRFQGRATNVPIRCIGVWDTVGALGIPPNRVFGRLQVCRAGFCRSSCAPLSNTLFKRWRSTNNGRPSGRRFGSAIRLHRQAKSSARSGLPAYTPTSVAATRNTARPICRSYGWRRRYGSCSISIPTASRRSSTSRRITIERRCTNRWAGSFAFSDEPSIEGWIPGPTRLSIRASSTASGPQLRRLMILGRRRQYRK